MKLTTSLVIICALFSFHTVEAKGKKAAPKEVVPEAKAPEAAPPPAPVAETKVEATPEAPSEEFKGKEDGFALSAGLNWRYGSAASSTGSTEARSINTLDILAAPGWQMGALAPRLLLSYETTGQNVDPSTVKNTNVRGSGYLIGLGATYLISNINILFGLEGFGTYTQGEKDSNGNTSTFSLPFGARLGGSYFFTQNFSADAIFHYVQYSENKVGDVVTSISTNRMRFITFGIGASYHL